MNLPNSAKKLVNIQVSRPVTGLSIPLRSNVEKIEITVDEIFNCICSKAIVDEVLLDGSTKRLDLVTYNQDNNLELRKIQEEKEAQEKAKLEAQEKANAKAIELEKIRLEKEAQANQLAEERAKKEAELKAKEIASRNTKK